MKSKVIAIALVGIFIYSCSPKVIPASEAKNEPLSQELLEGKSLYENNCAKCHKLYKSSDYSSAEWKPILLDMQKKAKITDQQRELIYSYLMAN